MNPMKSPVDRSILLLALAGAVLACAAVGPAERPAEQGAGAIDPRAEAARRVFTDAPCATCHRSSLPTAKPAALAVFDLDQGERWYAGMNEGQLAGLNQRGSGFDEPQRRIVDEFVRFATERLAAADTTTQPASPVPCAK
jgi:hypothetical protein